jgi:hypothetical protein
MSKIKMGTMSVLHDYVAVKPNSDAYACMAKVYSLHRLFIASWYDIFGINKLLYLLSLLSLFSVFAHNNKENIK